jgi:hypothetical protein
MYEYISQSHEPTRNVGAGLAPALLLALALAHPVPLPQPVAFPCPYPRSTSCPHLSIKAESLVPPNRWPPGRHIIRCNDDHCMLFQVHAFVLNVTLAQQNKCLCV